MRGGDRVEEFVTTDLLAVWTDPDTAMEAVGASLGIFGERVTDVRSVLTTDSPLRRALYAVLLDLVDGGALEKRALADGRYAFRWRDDIASASLLADVDVDIDLTVEPELPEPAPAPIAVSSDAPSAEVVRSGRSNLDRVWRRAVVTTAPLLFPSVSCILAIVAFLWLDRAGGLIIAAALTVVGVVGLVRRVPFAGLWIMGVFVAGVLLRFS
jgi:hypothetical protein